MDTTVVGQVVNTVTGEITVLINAVITAAYLIYKFIRRVGKK